MWKRGNFSRSNSADLQTALREECRGGGTRGTAADDDDVVFRRNHDVSVADAGVFGQEESGSSTSTRISPSRVRAMRSALISAR